MTRSLTAVTAVLSLLSVTTIAAQSGSAPSTAPPEDKLRVVVDGSKTPEAIRDNDAAFVVLRGLTPPPDAPPALARVQESRLKQIGLSASDLAILKKELASLSAQLVQSNVPMDRARSLDGSARIEAIKAAARTIDDAVLNTHGRLIEFLSRDGSRKWLAYVASTKKDIKLLAPPERPF